jgi:DNA gyrase subunit B
LAEQTENNTDKTNEIPTKANGSASAPANGNAESSASDYGPEHLQALKGLEGIRHRPAMYIGDTTTLGLHHLVYELVDNCIDECANGHASHLSVVIHADGSVSVADDGRGIPVGPMPEEDNKSALEVVLTNIHAGGKFNRDGGYKVGTGGLHGVGIKAVNALAEWLEAEIRREGHVWTMDFARGKPTTELKKLGKSDTTGTKITFKADPEIFPDTRYNFEPLAKRLQELAFLNAGVRIERKRRFTTRSSRSMECSTELKSRYRFSITMASTKTCARSVTASTTFWAART